MIYDLVLVAIIGDLVCSLSLRAIRMALAWLVALSTSLPKSLMSNQLVKFGFLSTFIIVLCKERVKLHILKTDANLAVGAVWTNHGDSSKLFMLGGLDELKDFIISRDEHIAFFEFVFI
jgi:hypothetical protein